MKYEAPKCEFIKISGVDIICTSPAIDEDDKGLGDTDLLPAD